MVLVMVLAAGCKAKSPTPTSGSGAPAVTGSGSAAVTGSGSGSGSAVGSAAQVGEAPPPTCDLAGKYRVRFTWNGTKGYWLRFTVGGTPPAVTLDVEPHMLSLGPKVDAKLDLDACTIAMVGGNKAAERQVHLTVDPRTHLVTGKLVRPAEKDASRETPVAGVHDVPGAKHAVVPAACFEPGIYAIDIDKTAKWNNTAEGDDRSCKETPDMFDPIHIRVEHLAGEVTIDTVEAKPPYRELVLIDETVTFGKACDVALETFPESVQLQAQLTFAPGGKVTGIGKRAEYQFVEDGDAGENIWSCETKDIPLTIKRIATP